MKLLLFSFLIVCALFSCTKESSPAKINNDPVPSAFDDWRDAFIENEYICYNYLGNDVIHNVKFNFIKSEEYFGTKNDSSDHTKNKLVLLSTSIYCNPYGFGQDAVFFYRTFSIENGIQILQCDENDIIEKGCGIPYGYHYLSDFTFYEDSITAIRTRIWWTEDAGGTIYHEGSNNITIYPILYPTAITHDSKAP